MAPARDPWQSVHDSLRAEIVTGVLAPGTRLMEHDLAQRFATSRGPVRGALAELARCGLVIANPRRGTFVLGMSPRDVDEIFSLYGAVAPLGFRLACERVTPDDLAHLRDLLEPVDGAHGEIPAMIPGVIDAALRFQRAVFEIARHGRLLAIWDTIESQARVLAAMLVVGDPGDVPDIADFRILVFDALVGRDARAGERIVSRYAEQIRQAFARGRLRTRPTPRGRPA